MAPVVAVDFGTSCSAAAVVVGDRVVGVKEPASGSYSLPSAVCADGEGPLLVGTVAEHAKRRRPDRYRNEFKRDLGREVQISLGERAFPVEELVAAVLAALRAHAGAVAGVEVTAGVLTVPAGAGTVQREAMLAAAARAGFDPGAVGLVEEPVAAAFAPAAGAPLPPGEAVLVYDFGGGTFDAALVRVGADGASHQVIDHAGLAHCGGYDVDQLVYADILAAGGEQARARLVVDPDAEDRVAQAARRAQLELLDMTRQIKHQLSERPSAGDYFVAGDIEYEIDRVRFDTLIAPLVDQTIDCCLGLLDRNQMTPDQVAAVLLVGGSTRMPLVADTLTRRLGRPLRRAEDPELAVAHGAAHQHRHQTATPPTSARGPGHPRRNQANVTKLIQDPDWEATPEPARERLLNAVLTSPDDEVIEDLIPDAAYLATRTWGDGRRMVRVKVALLVTSARVLWAGATPSGQRVSGQVLFADATDVVPVSSTEGGLCGLRLRAAEKWADFELPELDEATLLGWITYIGERLPSGAPGDKGAMLANLTKLTGSGAYKPGSQTAAWLAHAVVTAKTPEQVWCLELCTSGQPTLLTTSERLLWTHEGTGLSTVNQMPLSEIAEMGPLSTADAGLFGFRVASAAREPKYFRIAGADRNLAYIRARRGDPPPAWAPNLDRLRGFPGWSDVHPDARNWLVHAIVAADDAEEVRQFANCSYVGDSFWGQDANKATALLVTTQRVLWARVGKIAGLSSGAASISRVKFEPKSNKGITMTIDGKKHGFVGFAPDDMLRELRRWHD